MLIQKSSQIAKQNQNKNQNLLKRATIHFYRLLDELHFTNISTL